MYFEERKTLLGLYSQLNNLLHCSTYCTTSTSRFTIFEPYNSLDFVHIRLNREKQVILIGLLFLTYDLNNLKVFPSLEYDIQARFDWVSINVQMTCGKF